MEKKLGLVGLITSVLFAGCTINKKIVDIDLAFANYKTKRSSAYRLSHSVWVSLNEKTNKIIEVDSNSQYEMVFLAYARNSENFVYMDLPNQKTNPKGEGYSDIENLSLFIGQKNRTWQAEIKYGVITEDSNYALFEFVGHDKKTGSLSLDFDKKKFLIQYESNTEKEKGYFSELDIFFVDPMFTNKP